MTEKEIAELIQNELIHKSWGFTEQISELHSPLYNKDDSIQIENITSDHDEQTVYVPLLNESFYLTFYINSEKKEITGISTEPQILIYFKAISENMNCSELKKMTLLEISESWNKGDQKKSQTGSYHFSGIKIESDKKPDRFEKKMEAFLSKLQKDRNGIIQLSQLAETTIQVLIDFHNGNGLLGGPFLSKNNIKQLADLNLSVDFDLYVSGKQYIS
ncbi:MAG: DUF4279 domain-containing protein [Chryseobacterium sp.]|jgi:hypothetical protein|uniref:DUF4279 domain-containing protein n=1 Tax=Chryseobacterium sp. TaxID=1871047 RepID=UPI0028213BA1|nr:DUF4279 domain-containing protein [Chryseobacterium sp.]MDR2236923.1 DUF4279 domain-containing protein [Chryseobacterium sp.]